MEGILNTTPWASSLIADSQPMTAENLREAFKRLEERESEVCPHIVHPMATGLTPCAAMCGAIIDIGDVPISQRNRQ